MGFLELANGSPYFYNFLLVCVIFFERLSAIETKLQWSIWEGGELINFDNNLYRNFRHYQNLRILRKTEIYEFLTEIKIYKFLIEIKI